MNHNDSYETLKKRIFPLVVWGFWLLVVLSSVIPCSELEMFHEDLQDHLAKLFYHVELPHMRSNNA
jgi:hypothetical protein